MGDRIVSLASGRFLWFAALAVFLIKIGIPLGAGGLASLIEPVLGLNTTDIIFRTNEERAAAGLKPLAYNVVLQAAAQQRLQDMADKGYFAHVSPAGALPWTFMESAGYRYSVAGENLARGFFSPEQVVRAWMSSPPHRANIVHGQYTQVGIASGRITLNGEPATVVVQMFAAPGASPSFAVAQGPPPVIAQPVSTDRNVPEAPEPRAVAVREGSSGGLVSDIQNMLAVLLTAAMGVLIIAVRFGHRPKRVLWHAAGHALLLIALTLAPSLPVGRLVIF